jgi:hypothetical protein
VSFTGIIRLVNSVLYLIYQLAVITESEYDGLVIENAPDGIRVPDAFSSSTDIVKVPLTLSPGAGDPGSV